MFSPRRYCRYRIYLGCVLFYSSFSQPCHTSPCWPPPMSSVASWSTFSQLCPVLAQAPCGIRFLLGDWHWHRCLNYLRQDMLPGQISRIFALLVTYIAYRILLSTRVCDIAVLIVLVVAVSCLAFWRCWETIRVINPFDR